MHVRSLIKVDFRKKGLKNTKFIIKWVSKIITKKQSVDKVDDRKL